LHEGPLSFRLRRRGLGRLDRSWVKHCGSRGWEEMELRHRLYAAGDPAIEAMLRRARPAARFVIRIHRLGWPRPG